MSSILPKNISLEFPGGVKKQRVRTRSRAKDTKSTSSTSSESYTSAKIWKSALSWRIALVVFLTVLLVQILIFSVTVKDYTEVKVKSLSSTTFESILSSGLLNELSNPSANLSDLKSNLKDVITLKVYNENSMDLVHSHGEKLTLNIEENDLSKDNIYNYNKEEQWLETYYSPEVLSLPYYLAVRINAKNITKDLDIYIEHTILIILLVSCFITTILMIALGSWLLLPIFFLRDNLVKAKSDPENPGVESSPFSTNDEIGAAIDIAMDLIEQNANHLKKIKSDAQDQIHRLAYYDMLTGLPNRTLFIQNLNEQARAMVAEGTTGRFAVIALDLDHFKDVNDTMGHNIGDAILRAVGKRLRASLPKSAEVARSGEDEFAITMPLTEDINKAKDIAERVIGVIRTEPFKVFNENFQIRASIGVATFPDDGSDPDQVLKNADIALNRAKEEGRDTIKEYTEDFDRAVQQRFQMLRDLRDAMEHEQLLLHYQPQFDLISGKIIGAEALLRWWKPDNSKEGGRFISPADFIPIAEQSGLIVPIGEWVLRTACINAYKWNQAGIDVRIAVNVSGVQFYQSDIIGFVSRVLRETKLDPEKLELEVTESIFMEDINQTIQTLKELHKLGIELAIDDFGTGYSSLSYLRQFPVDRLKIDQSFIRNALNNPDDASIARTIVRLGHSLNLKVIAEGVETKEHESFLLEEECDEVQGFRYSRPVPSDQFKKFAENYNGKLSSFDNQ